MPNTFGKQRLVCAEEDNTHSLDLSIRSESHLRLQKLAFEGVTETVFYRVNTLACGAPKAFSSEEEQHYSPYIV